MEGKRWLWPKPIIVSTPSDRPTVNVESPEVTAMLERMRRRALREARRK